MSQEPNSSDSDKLRPEYDFSEGVRGKHYKDYQKGYKEALIYSSLVIPAKAGIQENQQDGYPLPRV